MATNQATVNYTYTGARDSVNTDSNIVTTSITSGSEISIVKYPIGETFIPGDIHTFVIRVENTGTTSIDNVVITDNLGAVTEGDILSQRMEYVDGTASYSLNNSLWAPYELSSINPIGVNVGTLQPGDVYEFIYSARILENVTDGTITNVTTVSGTADNETVSATASSTITAASFARVVVVKSQSSENPVIGEDFSYTLNLTNTGNLDATSVLVTDELPENFSLESVDMINGGITTTLDPADYSYENNLLTIPANTSTLELTVPANGELRFILNGRFTSAD